jgi:protein-disulfide isomerase
MRRAARHAPAVPALSAVVALALAFGGGVAPAGAAAFSDDMTLGSPQAPLTVVEYASVGCPHCAVWEQTVFPAFKKKYIDTGKIRFVFRELLTGQQALAAAGFLTARCAGGAHYFEVVDAIFRDQQAILESGEAYQPLLHIAEQAGITAQQFDACVQDQEALKALSARANRNGDADKVEGTPAFVIGDRKLEGEQTLADLDAAIAAATNARRKAVR